MTAKKPTDRVILADDPAGSAEGANRSPRGEGTARRQYRVARLSRTALRERRKHLGGTDVAAVLGVSTRRSAWDVYAEKVLGVVDDSPPNRYAEWGQRLEAVVRWYYEDQSGRRLTKPRKPMTHPRLPFLAGHLDGLDDEIVWEGKTARSADGWGESGTDAVPVDYRLQVLTYCAITGRRRWVISVLIGGSDYREFDGTVDDDTIADLEAAVTAWWDQHVVRRIEPPFDGSDAATRHLNRRIPDGSQLVALPEQYPTIGRLIAAERLYAEAKVDRERMRQVVRDAMGGASTLLAPGVRVTVTAAERKVVDWQALVGEWSRRLAAQGVDLRIGLGDYTTTTRVQSVRVTLGPEADALTAAAVPLIEGAPDAE